MSSTILELAVYKVKRAELPQFAEARAQMVSQVATWPGYRSGVTFRSLQSDVTFLDYFLWDSIETAKTAAEAIKTSEPAKAFLGSIGEIVFFGHFSSDAPLLSLEDFPNDEVLEVALSEIAPRKEQANRDLKSELFSLVSEQSGFERVVSATSVNGDGVTVNIDLLQWQSLPSAHAAMEAVHDLPQCAAFMSTYMSRLMSRRFF